MKQYCLFDLDGTLTDPKVGITSSVQYALQAFGIEEPDLDKLEPFIGPPLRDSFKKYYQMTDEQAKEAVEKYRERFQDTGIFENEVYGGVPQMLKALKNSGIHLAVASSKPKVFVDRILEHFHLMQYFDVVVGSELDGTREEKAEVVSEALRQLFGDKPIDKEQVYMIGDRSYDVEGAKALHIESVGVTYGYGSIEELKAARADYIVGSVKELEKFLLRGAEEKKEEKISMFQRIWTILYSFLMFLLVRSVAMYGVSWLLSQLTPGIGDFFFVEELVDGETQVSLTGTASTLIAAIGYLAGAAAVFSTAKILIQKTKEESRLSHLSRESAQSYLFMGITTVTAVLGLNLFFELSGITDKSAAYQAVLDDQYAAPFLLGILCYGVVTPFAEEILFRGIIYNYMKRFLDRKLAFLFSAAIFGLYHVNMVQGIYAFIMGCLIAYAYEYFGDFAAAVCVHMAANMIAYCLSYTALAEAGFFSWPVCLVCLAVCVVCLRGLEKQKTVL